MSGNASRYSHQQARRYSQLILSQGAMVTDADQREGQAIGLRNTTTLGATAIRTGVPETGGIVTWDEAGDPSAHKIMTGIRPGRVVADGHVGEVRATGDSGTAPGLELLHLQADLLGQDPLADTDGPYALFADLWHRHAGPAEDGRLTDPAFLAAETATRTELMAQLKLARLENGASDAGLAARIEAEGLPRYGDFRLMAVDFADEVVEPDVCDPCATTLEDPNQDAGNSLFRLEIHRSSFNTPRLDRPDARAGIPADPRIQVKWSHDNGSTEVPVSAADALLSDPTFDTAVFELTFLPAEQRLGLYTDGMTDRLASLHSRADIEAAMAGAPEGALLRVWDGAVTLDLDTGDLAPEAVGALSAEGTIARTGDSWTLEIEVGGLALTLQAGDVPDVPYILPGDAWAVEIREYATETGDKLIWQPEPAEVEHHYAYVGVLENGGFRNEDEPDMRARAFPALTELDALDIRYDHSRSGAEAWTVQGALDLLFAKPAVEGHDCHCTYCVVPEDDLAGQLARFADEIAGADIAHALICIPAGRHELSEPVTFKGPGAVTIRGAGRDLTVIEISGTRGGAGMLDFVGASSIRLEEMSFVGDMKVAEPEAGVWLIGAFDAGAVRMSRLSMRVTGEVKALTHGLRVSVLEDKVASAAVTVSDCLFRLGGNTQGLAIWRGASTLRVEDSDFRSLSAETFGGVGRLSALNEFIARTRVDRRTPAREAQINDGFFAPYPGNPELLLNFTDLPPDTRRVAERYWVLALSMMEGQGRIDEVEEFGRIQLGLHTIHSASGTLAEAEAMAMRSEGGPAAFGLRVDRPPVLGALIGRDRPLEISEPPSRRAADSFVMLRPILVAGGSIEGDAVVDRGASASDRAALVEIKRANEFLVDDLKVADFIDRMAPILDLVAREATEPGPPIWGIFCLTDRAIPAVIAKNRFTGPDVAIDLVANVTKPPADPLVPPVATVIRDNVIRRPVRLNRLMPPIWGEGAGNIVFGRQPVTVTNAEDLTVENVDVSQVMSAGTEQREIEVIYGPNFPTGMQSFAAISVNNRIGPKLRVIGNASFLFRHCLHVNALPWKPFFDPDDPPPAHWVLRENSALPLIRGETGRQPAVELNSEAMNEVDRLFALHISDNWLPNDKLGG